jgi:DNA polymerase-3 subunit alpha
MRWSPVRVAGPLRPVGRAVERMEFELGVIEEMGFASCFLIVWDFVRCAKENGVAVGPGRGSAAGSIVSYALAITDLVARRGLIFSAAPGANRCRTSTSTSPSAGASG